MTPDLRAIIDELAALDPAVRGREAELLPVLEELLRHRPHTEPDPAFVERLRLQLREHAASLAAAGRRRHPISFLPSLAFALTGVFVGVVVAVPAVTLFLRQTPLPMQSAPADDREAPAALKAIESSPSSLPSALRGTEEKPTAADDALIDANEAERRPYTLEGTLPPLPQGTVNVLARPKAAPASGDVFLMQQATPAPQEKSARSGTGAEERTVTEDTAAPAGGQENAYRSVPVPAVSDSARIRAFLDAFIARATDEPVAVRLGAPFFVFIPDENGDEERVIPALSFPILNRTAFQAFPYDAVTVPLAEETFEREMRRMGR